jgi:tetratricopeptide (TPR) repeat protein
MILLAVPFYGYSQQGHVPDFDTLLAVAQNAQQRSDYAGAADAYKKALKIHSDVPEVWANLGLMENELADYSHALTSFRNANHLKPSLYVPNLFLGIDYIRMGKASNAIPYLLKAKQINSKDPQAPLALGRAYSAMGNHTSAINEYRRAIKLNVTEHAVWFDIGIAYLGVVENNSRSMSSDNPDTAYAKALLAESLIKQTRYLEGEALYKSILIMKEQPPCMRSELGYAYLKQNDHKNAELEFDEEMKASPVCSLAALGLARLNIENGENVAALEIIEGFWSRDQGFVRSNISQLIDGIEASQAAAFARSLLAQKNSTTLPPDLYSLLVSIFTEDANQPTIFIFHDENNNGVSKATQISPAALRSAEEYFKSGQYGKCAAVLKNSATSMKQESLNMLAACAFMSGDYELTSSASQRLLASAPHSAQALYWSIKANEKLAFESLDMYQRLEPNSKNSHILLGDIFRQQHRYDDAQVEYKLALEISPNDPAALLGLANAYFGNLNIEKTIETVQTAMRNDPNGPELNLIMGEALVHRKNYAEAKPYLEKSLAAKPQMLPHVHALLGQAELFRQSGDMQYAIAHLKLGLPSDEDGSVHYQLARAYQQVGDRKNAAIAIEQMKSVQRQNRKHAETAVAETFPMKDNEVKK